MHSGRRVGLWALLPFFLMILFLSGCASTLQYPAFPDQTAQVQDPAKARVYVMRPSKFLDPADAILIYETDADNSLPQIGYGRGLIGELGPASYLCWETEPRSVLLGRPLHPITLKLIKNHAYYLRIGFGGLVLMNQQEGERMLKKCKPPKAERIKQHHET